MVGTLYIAAEEFSSRGEKAGLAIIGAAGTLSAFSTFGLLIYILWQGVLAPPSRRTDVTNGIRGFLRSSLGGYLTSLLVSDCIQGIAFAMNFRWSSLGRIEAGPVCSAQGGMSQLGDLGSVVWSLCITCHTFSVLFYTRRPPTCVAPLVLSCGWIIIIVLPIVGPTAIQQGNESFYSVSGAWCWISTPYEIPRLFYFYVWALLDLALSIVLYSLIYLRFSGYLVVEGAKVSIGKGRASLACLMPWSSSANHSSHLGSGSNSGPSSGQLGTNLSDEAPVGKHVRAVSRKLMLYPFAFFFNLLPVSIAKLGLMSNWNPPFWFFALAGTCFCLTGTVNVVLFLLTRHSFIRKVHRNRKRIHITTHQITVVEGDRDIGTITSPKTPNIRVNGITPIELQDLSENSSLEKVYENGHGHHSDEEDKMPEMDGDSMASRQGLVRVDYGN